jgi:trk system potassium uptake protein TrkH
MTIAGASWIAVSVLGSLPFFLAAHVTPEGVMESYVPSGADYSSSLLYFRNPLHAIFESVSGWTTTGLTMAVHEPSLPHAHLLYRSMQQWLGGAGVIVLALALLHRPGTVGGYLLYRAEGREERLRPTLIGTARVIWRVYVAVTAATAFYLFVCTLIFLPDYPVAHALFDAVNHAMAGQSTGGFSVLDDSIASYSSLAMDIVHIPPMVSGAIAIPVHYAALTRKSLMEFLRDGQTRVMLAIMMLGCVCLSVLLVGSSGVSAPYREGVFQFISAVSTTGWQTSAIGDWTPTPVLFIVFAAMIAGGCAGATVGGIKILRVMIMVRGFFWQVRRLFLPPSAVAVFRLGNEVLDRTEMEEEIGRAAIFTVCYLFLLAVGVFVLALTMGPGFTLADMTFESVTAQSTVGLSSGITSPDMPVAAEVMFIVQMLAGRLEIIPLVVLARSVFRGFGRQ